jgi:hypothetical protein
LNRSMTWRGSIETPGSADSRVGIVSAGRSQQGGVALGQYVQTNEVVLGVVRWHSPGVVTAHQRCPRSSFLHGVALGLCSNACTAFRAFKRSLMKSVTCGLGYGNPRNPTHQNHPYLSALPLEDEVRAKGWASPRPLSRHQCSAYVCNPHRPKLLPVSSYVNAQPPKCEDNRTHTTQRRAQNQIGHRASGGPHDTRHERRLTPIRRTRNATRKRN